MRIEPCSSVVITDEVGCCSASRSNLVWQVVHCTARATTLPTGKTGMKKNVNQRRSTSATHVRSPPQRGQKNSPVSCWCFDQRPRNPNSKIIRPPRRRSPSTRRPTPAPYRPAVFGGARTYAAAVLQLDQIERALVVTAHPD